VVIEQGHLAVKLAGAAKEMGVALDEPILTRFVDFVSLLRKWNRVHNLTALTDESEILTHHLLDSLSVVPFISGVRCLDVGSGAGLPGIALALCNPAQDWTLVESRGKKASFLREVTARLKLDNVTVFAGRIEDYRPDGNFDTLVARAVASLASLFNMTDHLLHHHLRLIAMKGTHPQAELDALAPAQRLTARVIPVTVPGLLAQRHLVVLDGLPGGPI
jgi:16S rRNA (guanine527-N7)-methyltransferase